MKFEELRKTQPAGRGQTVMVRDPVSGKPIIFGGLGQGFKEFKDVWSFDFDQLEWSKITEFDKPVWFHSGFSNDSTALISMETELDKSIYEFHDSKFEKKIPTDAFVATSAFVPAYNMGHWSHIIYGTNGQVFYSSAKTRKNKDIKNMKWQNNTWVDTNFNFEIEKRQKHLVKGNYLYLFTNELRKIKRVNLETGSLDEIGLDYDRKEKTDEKQPKREGFGLAENPQNGKIIISGGYDISDSNKYTSMIFEVDLEEKKLKQLGQLPYARTEHSCMIDPTGSKMIIFGGFHDGGKYSKTLICSL